jgi:hypothetical protein
MSYTLQQSVDWSRSMITTYIPLTSQTVDEPAITIANMVIDFMLGPPFCWPTNRKEDSSLVTVAGTQDYTVNLADFGFLEKVTLTGANLKSFDILRVYNSLTLGVTTQQINRPESISVKLVTPSTSIAVRFMGAPDAAYTATLTYQKIPVLFTSLAQDWYTQCNIPQNQSHIYNNLFLAEAFQVNGDDQAAAMYRRRGMASLLAMSEGLSEAQKNMMFAQATYSDLQAIAANLRTQAAQQARVT